MNNIVEYDIRTWVKKAQSEANIEFRKAVHTILSAIASDCNLKASMILKGGILLAIRYQSHRHTKDIDFSTEKKLGGEITQEKIRDSLDLSLAQIVEYLDYDLDCRVQSCRIKPTNPKATYPSMKLTIGYAYKGTAKHKRLLVLKSPDVVYIDYSLNEATPNIENLTLNGDRQILAYTLTDLIAEKYRALLQQVDRERNRRQDIFDLNLLFEKLKNITEKEKLEILKCLIFKSKARGISPKRDSFDIPEIKSRAKIEYPNLKDEIDGELPNFDELFEKASRFYKSLPWFLIK